MLRATTAAWLLALPLAGCTAGGSAGGEAGTAATTATALEGTHWRLASGLPGMDTGGVEVTLAFESGRIVGSGGCNQYGADIHLDGGAVALGPVVATKRGCPGLRMAVETAYFGALEHVTALRRDGDALLLEGPDPALRFEPATARAR